MTNFLISGGSGILGQALIKNLKQAGHQVQILTRSPSDGNERVHWDPLAGTMDHSALHKPDVVIHLAGSNVGSKRWTKSRRQEILDSRVSTGAFLFSQLSNANCLPSLYVTSSGINYYGYSDDKAFTEKDPNGTGFLAQVCKDWESIANLYANQGIRQIALRTGVVMGPKGTALQEMIQTFRYGIAGIPGPGNQTVSWIYIQDWVKAVSTILSDPKSKGAYNITAPNPCSLEDIITAAMQATGKRLIKIPAPSWMLKIVLGKKAELVLESLKVHPKRLEEMGFEFEASNIQQAMDLIMK